MAKVAKLEKEIKTIICEITEIPEEELEGDANFVDDMDITSIMAIDIINSIQEKYKLKIPEEMFGEFDCLDSVVELVQELLEDKVKSV